MAYTSSSSSSSDTKVSTCSKACLKSYETLKEHYDNLAKDFNKSQLNVGAYKAGLESLEARLDVYKKNEVVFEKDIKILKLDIMLRDNAKQSLEKNKLLDIQVSDKSKTGVGYDSQVFDSQVFDSHMNDKSDKGYHVVPPPYIGNFMPPKPDLVLADKDEYVFSESITSVSAIATSEVKTSVLKPKSVSEPLIEDWKSNSENKNEIEFKSRQRKPSNAKVKFVKSNKHVKSPRESVKKVENSKQANYPRKNSQSPKDCDYYEKKMLEKPVWNNAKRVNHQNSQRITHPHPKGNCVPRTVLMKSSLKTLNTAGQNSSRAAVSVNSTRPINNAYPRPIGNPQLELQEKGVIDSGCSRHMTGNKSYLSDYEEIDGGFVAFGGNSKGGKITRKGKIRTGKLDFEDATLDESNLWHRRLGHINFKTMNKLVRGNLVRGLPSKIFENDHTCVACQKGKQHKASCKTKTVSSISQPLQMLHMDLFGLTFVKSIMKKMYCLVVTDDFSRFSWVFFLATKDETSGILKAFITGIENQINHRVKIIRCDNGTEFKNKEMNQFCEAEVVNTACYVQNRVLVVKPHNKTSYELFHGRTLSLSFMRPFGCLVTILNTLDHLGKFDGKADEGIFVGYSVNSMAFRVFNNRNRIVEETLHITFLENKPNVAGSGPEWLFDIDTLTKFMNYKPVVTGNQSNRKSSKDSPDVGFKPLREEEKKDAEDSENKNSEVPSIEDPIVNQEKDANINNTNNINNVSPTVNVASIKDSVVDENIVYGCVDDPNMPNLEETVYSDNDEDVGVKVDMTNLDTHIPVILFQLPEFTRIIQLNKSLKIYIQHLKPKG
ncbi:putative ribonuclease H-like domain-containing protein [Tanacetum coccineum]